MWTLFGICWLGWVCCVEPCYARPITLSFMDVNINHSSNSSHSDLTGVHSWLSFAQPFSHRFGNHPVEKVVRLLHLIVQHLHALFQLTGLLLLLDSKETTFHPSVIWDIRTEETGLGATQWNHIWLKTEGQVSRSHGEHAARFQSVANLYESSLQLLGLLCACQHQVSAGVVHAQVIDVQTGFEHRAQALHPRKKTTTEILFWILTEHLWKHYFYTAEWLMWGDI